MARVYKEGMVNGAVTFDDSQGGREATVSVVVPLYNKGLYVERAISSILNQTYPADEIIVVDDGSTDNGPEKVLNFRNPKITLIRQENRGPGAARNAGLGRANGKYVAFLDADDEWLPCFLETGLSWLEDRERDITAVYAACVKYPERQNLAMLPDAVNDTFEVNPETSIKLVRSVLVFTCICTAIMRTSVVRKWGGFFDGYGCTRGEDKHLFYKIVFNERIGIIRQPMGIYHTEASSLYAGGKVQDFEMEPYMMDDSDLMSACPESKRGIMGRVLADMTLAGIRTLALRGHVKEARMLMSRLRPNESIGDSLRKKRMHVFVEVSLFFPYIRPVWHAAKLIFRRENSHE